MAKKVFTDESLEAFVGKIKEYTDDQVATKTSVTVGGNPVQTFDADSKVDKSESEWIVYGTAGGGTQKTHRIATAVAFRQSGNLISYSSPTNTMGDTEPSVVITTGAPTKIAHATNKKYVDEQVQAAKDASVAHTTVASGIKRAYINNGGTDEMRTIAHSYNFTNAGNLVQYFGSAYGSTEPAVDGYLLCRTPTKDYHATTKKYVDDTVNTMGDTKVDKVEGKELSTNDLTDELKSNYDIAYTHSQTAHAPSNAQANKIESIKVNGTAQTITSKSVDITVPTKVSELTNDSSFATTSQVATDIATAKQEFFTALNTVDTSIRTDLNAVTGSLANEIDDIADTKLDKTTVGNKVYCTDGNGNQSTRTITSSPTAGAIPVYGTSGILPVGDPTADSSAANKKYVDDQLDGKVSKSGDTMTGMLGVTNQIRVLGDSWTSLNFRNADNTKTRAAVMISDSNCIHFNNMETGATYCDRYKLPDVTTGKTADTWYAILTSKNAVTVAQGGTGATTASAARTNLGAMSATNPTGTGSFSLNRKSGTTVGDYSHAEGNGNTASGKASHAEGMTNTTASGLASHAEGQGTTASGTASHSEGGITTASGMTAHAEGYETTASGDYSHAEGGYTTASGNYSHAGGYETTANAYQRTVGKYNTNYANSGVTANTQNTANTDALFIVGCGTSSAKKNAFRVTTGGKCYGSSAFGASGADFAELFEWADSNPNNEDRRGLFVALEGEKIRLANADDDYIGVISGAQAFIGNSASEEWNGKYLSDVFGTKLSQEVEIPEERDEVTGEVITPAYTTTQYVLNPEYDPNEEYIMRENRKEWGIVGLLGQIIMIDDGTCTVGGYVKPSINGIGTASDSGYRVMKRVDENHIKVLVK